MNAIIAGALVAVGALAGCGLARLSLARRRARSDMQAWDDFCRALNRPSR